MKSKAEVRAAVTKLTGDNMKLTTQVVEYANHLDTKESEMASMQKLISYIQGK